MAKKKKVKSVFIFANGMCAVCDQNGKQMPEYQGKWSEMREAVRKAIEGRNDVEINIHPIYLDEMKTIKEA